MALIRNLSELKAHVPFTLGMKMDNMSSFITQAEEQFLIPAIGYEAFQQIQSKYDNNDLADPDFKNLLELCQRSVAYYATLLFIPVGQLHISDAGIRIAVDEHFKQAFDWQIDNLEESCRNAADLNLELTLALLDSKPAVFTVYHSSPAKQSNKQYFVNSAELLNQLAGVKIPRRHFQKVLAALRKIQVLQIEPVLCSPLYNELLTQWRNSNVSANNTALLNMIQPAMANLAIAKCVSALTIEFSQLGVTHAPANVSALKMREAASDAARAHFIHDKMDEGRSYLSLLEQYLQDNASSYPLFLSSPCYKNGNTFQANIDPNASIYIV